MKARNLADFLSRAELRSVIGMPMGDVRGFYLDVVLSSSDATVRLNGAASDLPDRTEAFLLTATDIDPAQRWTGPEGKPGWEVEDLLASWKETGKAGLWLGQRSVRYFFDPEDRSRGLTVQGPFDSAAAIEFSPVSGRPNQCLVFYATPEYPCAIEVATTLERCDALLATLEEFTPQISGSVLMTGR
ncbi:MAG: hypothetical protein JNM66_20060 [Bryobacterales bacterium]|nr:hypothetical protein [Bryobacterales bacterium]